MTMSSCIHRNTGRSGSCWQIATGTGSLSGVFHVFHQWPGLASCSAHSLPSGRDPWYPMYPMNLKSRNISKQAPFRWHLEVSECVRQKSHVRHTCQTWRRCTNLPRWSQCCRNFLDSLLLYLLAIHWLLALVHIHQLLHSLRPCSPARNRYRAASCRLTRPDDNTQIGSHT